MILTARRSLVAKVARHQAPQIDIFFLNIHVRRSHLVSDSLNEVGEQYCNLTLRQCLSLVRHESDKAVMPSSGVMMFY